MSHKQVGKKVGCLVGDGISQNGRNVGAGIWGSYVNDGAHYVKDATGAIGHRAGSAGNPLGMAKSKGAARTSGFSSYTPYKGKWSAEQKAIAPAASAAGKAEQSEARSAVGAQVAAHGRAKAIASAEENYDKKKAAAGPGGISFLLSLYARLLAAGGHASFHAGSQFPRCKRVSSFASPAVPPLV